MWQDWHWHGQAQSVSKTQLLWKLLFWCIAQHSLEFMLLFKTCEEKKKFKWLRRTMWAYPGLPQFKT